jgi:hypothetical protein
VNQDIYRHVADALGVEGRAQIDQMLRADETASQTLWNTIKADPGKPTLTQLRELVARLKWLSTYNHGAIALAVTRHPLQAYRWTLCRSHRLASDLYPSP